MRAVLVSLLGVFVFFLVWPVAQLVVLGADRVDIEYFPPPSISTRYARWLLAVLLAALPTGLLMRKMWRLMSR